MGFTLEEVGLEYLDEFISLYYATMDRVGAKQLYYFERPYFDYLFNEMGDNVKLFMCRHGETAACFVLNFVCNEQIHGYLYAENVEYHKLCISKLLYDEVIKWGHRKGYKTLHMGGGKESLRDFKLSFGGSAHVQSTWRYVADRKVYDNLCSAAFEFAGKTPADDYFPEYRSPSLGLIRK